MKRLNMAVNREKSKLELPCEVLQGRTDTADKLQGRVESPLKEHGRDIAEVNNGMSTVRIDKADPIGIQKNIHLRNDRMAATVP